jgi:hypothetical protein
MKDVLNGEGLVFLLGTIVIVRIRLRAKGEVVLRLMRLSERTKVRRLYRGRNILDIRCLSKVE